MKIRTIVIGLSIILVVSGIVACSQLNKWYGYFKEGNASKYNVENVKTLKNSPLAAKKIIFLGSSVTYGAAAMHNSFVEYIGKRDSVNVIKEAVSGTTLVDNGKNSYVERMLNKLDPQQHIDCFVCQLSTNDATKNSPLGEIASSTNMRDFDTKTTTGAIEYIISYARKTWNCPVVFFTNPQYNSEAYGKMVNRLLEIQNKWSIGVLNLWDDKEMNTIDAVHRKLYMNDEIHPTKAGYLEWWTPKFEEYLNKYLD